jgi:hypothetical protein
MKKFIIIILCVFIAESIYAQQPKFHLKAFGGYNTHIFVYKELEKSQDIIHGWQGGFGFRVTHKKFMAEGDFIFLRNSVIVPIPDSVVTESFNKFEFKLYSFDLPLKVGFVPVKTPLFKWYCYTGASFRFNTQGKLKINDEEFKFKPKEVGLANPNVDFILGTQVDIGWLNIDLLYGLGVTNSLRQNIRTNSHEIQINVGIIF